MVLQGCIKLFFSHIGIEFLKKNNPMVPPLIEILKIGKNEKMLIFCQNNQHVERSIFRKLARF